MGSKQVLGLHRAGFGRVLPDNTFELDCGHRAAEVKSLILVATHVLQEIKLCRSLDAFGHHLSRRLCASETIARTMDASSGRLAISLMNTRSILSLSMGNRRR